MGRIISVIDLPDLLFGPSVDDLVHALFVTPHAPADDMPIDEIEWFADEAEHDTVQEILADES